MLLFSPNGYTCSSSFPRLSERAPAHISLMPRSPPADRVVFGHLAAGGPSRALEIKTSQLTRGGECSCVLRACHREVPGKAPGQSRDSNDKNRDTRFCFLIFTSYKISHCLTWTASIATVKRTLQFHLDMHLVLVCLEHLCSSISSGPPGVETSNCCFGRSHFLAQTWRHLAFCSACEGFDLNSRVKHIPK